MYVSLSLYKHIYIYIYIHIYIYIYIRMTAALALQHGHHEVAGGLPGGTTSGVRYGQFSEFHVCFCILRSPSTASSHNYCCALYNSNPLTILYIVIRYYCYAHCSPEHFAPRVRPVLVRSVFKN